MFTDLAAVIPVMIILGGGFAVLVGLALFIGTIRFLLIAESAAGVVVGHETKVRETRDQDGFTTAHAHPVVEFEDAKGKQHRVTLATGTSGYQPFPVGKPVVILYPPDDTARARIRSFLHLWFFPVMFTVVGIVSILGGLWFRTWTSH